MNSQAPSGSPLLPDEIWLRYADSSLYTKEIESYMSQCRRYLSNLLTKSDYSSVIEIGCSDGSFLMQTVLAHQRYYLGIDFQEQAVIALKKKTKTYRNAKGRKLADATLGDAENLYRLVASKPHFFAPKALILYPFNVFGTLLNPKHVLRQSFLLRDDILLFSFDTDKQSTKVRKQYYGRIMQEQISCNETSEFVFCHSSSGFYSYAYKEHVILNFLEEAGYSLVEAFQEGEIAKVYYARLEK